MRNKLKIEQEWEKEHFDHIARKYERQYGYNDPFTKYKFKKKTDKFVSLIDLCFENKVGLRILEIGCGTGAYTVRYSQRLPKAKIVAIDISGEMIKIAREKHRVRKNLLYQKKSAYETGFKSSSFDVVCGFYILHHLNLKAAIKEIDRVLKPGGVVYFYEPNILNPLVFLIKSSQFLKILIGDSSEEWAINPLTVQKEWNKFKVIELIITEFVWPLSFIPFKTKLLLDKLTSSLFPAIPGLKLIGGSIEICLRKK